MGFVMFKIDPTIYKPKETVYSRSQKFEIFFICLFIWISCLWNIYKREKDEEYLRHFRIGWMDDIQTRNQRERKTKEAGRQMTCRLLELKGGKMERETGGFIRQNNGGFLCNSIWKLFPLYCCKCIFTWKLKKVVVVVGIDHHHSIVIAWRQKKFPFPCRIEEESLRCYKYWNRSIRGDKTQKFWSPPYGRGTPKSVSNQYKTITSRNLQEIHLRGFQRVSSPPFKRVLCILDFIFTTQVSCSTFCWLYLPVWFPAAH